MDMPARRDLSGHRFERLRAGRAPGECGAYVFVAKLSQSKQTAEHTFFHVIWFFNYQYSVSSRELAGMPVANGKVEFQVLFRKERIENEKDSFSLARNPAGRQRSYIRRIRGFRNRK